MTGRRLGPLLVLSFALAACAYAQDHVNPYRPEVVAQVGGPAGGEQLYARDCAWCHGAGGAGTDRAPDLVTGRNGRAMTHFMLTTGRMPLDFPEQAMHPGPPSYASEEIEELVDIVATFDQPGPDVPEVDLQDADLQLGAELYQENCAACHSTTGIGGALASGRRGGLPDVQLARTNIASDLATATPTEIAEAMIVGPGTMPVFGYDTFDDEEIDSIARYVVYLQDPNSRGGLSIGGIGPVAEGAIGWVLGLGVLLVFIRWLGTRTGER
ncbi:MAG: c-type cytochrome [Actinomycetota bacterium]